MQEVSKRVMSVMKATWGIRKRLFGGWHEKKIIIFDYLVKSILTQACEVWGWAEYRQLETGQETYLRWILQLPWHPPGYLVLKETKRNKIWIETGKKALKFKGKIRNAGASTLLKECLQEKQKERNNQERTQYFRRNGWD